MDVSLRSFPFDAMHHQTAPFVILGSKLVPLVDSVGIIDDSVLRVIIAKGV